VYVPSVEVVRVIFAPAVNPIVEVVRNAPPFALNITAPPPWSVVQVIIPDEETEENLSVPEQVCTSPLFIERRYVVEPFEIVLVTPSPPRRLNRTPLKPFIVEETAPMVMYRESFVQLEMFAEVKSATASAEIVVPLWACESSSTEGNAHVPPRSPLGVKAQYVEETTYKSLFAHCPTLVVAKFPIPRLVEVVRTAAPPWVIVPVALKAPPVNKLAPDTNKVELPRRAEPSLVFQNGK